MIHNPFISRVNTLVVPGGMMSVAMEVILAPIVQEVIDSKKQVYKRHTLKFMGKARKKKFQCRVIFGLAGTKKFHSLNS